MSNGSRGHVLAFMNLVIEELVDRANEEVLRIAERPSASAGTPIWDEKSTRWCKAVAEKVAEAMLSLTDEHCGDWRLAAGGRAKGGG